MLLENITLHKDHLFVIMHQIIKTPASISYQAMRLMKKCSRSFDLLFPTNIYLNCPSMIRLIYSLLPLQYSPEKSLQHKLSQNATLVHTDNILESIHRFPLTKLNAISRTKVALWKKLENLHKSLYSVDSSICRNIFFNIAYYRCRVSFW